MEETPEKQWEAVKAKIFKNGTPENLEKIVQDGFKESKSESEKWDKLALVLGMIKQKLQ